MLKALLCATLMMLSILQALAASAAEPAFHAGVTRLPVAGAAGTSNAIVWYPTEQPEMPWQAGPFVMAASRDAPVAAEGGFPVVLLSHGSRSDPLAHRELAASLARAGFVVAAPTHAGDAIGQPLVEVPAQAFRDRPGQALETLDAVLKDERFAPVVDTAKIGMIGFSAGGYTALVLAGAKPDFAAAARYCEQQGAEDVGSCGVVSGGGSEALAAVAGWQPAADPRVRALVLLDPAAVMFDAAGLEPVKVPVLLYRPQDDSMMRSEANALALKSQLPEQPEEIMIPGTHFTFIDPCPESIAAQAAFICKDGPGINRPAIHGEMERQIAAFLGANL